MSGFAHLAGKKVLVTGGTGFVGRHLLPRLVEAGAQVTCLVRASSRLDGLSVPTVTADLDSGQGLREALAGQDVLIHMAALLFGLGWQDYLRANACAAFRLAEALRGMAAEGRQLPSRVVLVSSLAAAGPSSQSALSAPAAMPAPVSAYGWSKLMVEQILGQALGDRLVIVRPPIIYGSGDRGLLPVFRGAARGFAVSPGLFREFPVSVAHVRDVAQAVMLCAGPAASGIYYCSDGQPHDMAGFCRAMGAALGRRVRIVRLPLWLMAATAALASCAGTLWAKALRLVTGRSPRRVPNWNLDKYREARQIAWLCDDARIRRELGYQPEMDLAGGMAEAVEGYRREGLI
ncbi:MAG: NAD-dependent epimerase/dehydratase family protein [Desulfovibrionaceae bacterium]|nr:NAD-dependent epimerase/dehydratase family protein [Desulfovibrionaceae bacterium]